MSVHHHLEETNITHRHFHPYPLQSGYESKSRRKLTHPESVSSYHTVNHNTTSYSEKMYIVP